MIKYFCLEFGSPNGGVQKYNIFKLCLSRNKEQYNQNFILFLTWQVLAILLADPHEVNGDFCRNEKVQSVQVNMSLSDLNTDKSIN